MGRRESNGSFGVISGKRQFPRERLKRHLEAFQDLLDRGVRWAAGDGIKRAVLAPLKYETPLLPENYKSELPVPKAQEPLSPQETLKRAQVPPGFEISLFAAEPDVVRPIAICWDERDRLWVVEAIDYPNNVGGGNDRIKICEDTDGDGKADKFTVFADRWPRSTRRTRTGRRRGP